MVLKQEQSEKSLRDLIDVIHFAEKVSAKIHGALSEAEIYRTVKEEFAKSKRYNASILLLTDNGSKLRFAETSLSPERVKAGERMAGLRSYKSFCFEVSSSRYFCDVVREGKTIEANFVDAVGDLLPRTPAYWVSKIMGYEERIGILTPLRRHGKIVGVLVVDSTELAEYFIPSVKNLAHHISSALELSEERAERKKAEERLREANRKLETLLATAMESIATTDSEENLTYVNKAFAEMLGYDENQMPGINLKELTSEQDFMKIRSQTERRKQGKTSRYEITLNRKDGEPRTVQVSSAPLWDGEGKYVGSLGIIMDITDRKQAEDKLAHERDLLQTLMDSIPDSIFFKDTDCRLIKVNRAAVKCTHGTSGPEDLIGKTDFDTHPRELAEQYYADDQAIIQSGQAVIMKEEPSFDGKWVSTTKVPVKNKAGQVIGIVGIARDITERKKAEEALARERDLLQSLMDNVPDHVYFKDVDLRFVRLNRAVAQSHGLADPGELVGRTDFDIHPRELAEQYYMDDQEIIRTGRPLIDREEPVVYRTGEKGWLSTTKVPTINNAGNVTGIVGISRDITERKRMEEELRSSEERLRILFEYAPDAIYLNDMKGNFVDGNKAAEEMTGYKRDELIGKNFFRLDLLPRDQVLKAAQLLARNVLRQPTGPDELVLNRKDSTQAVVEVMTFPVKIKDQRLVLGIARNITERKRMEEELRRYSEHLEELVEERTRKLKEAERLAAIGETAAMVGHDLRNPLQVVANLLYSAKKRLKSMSHPELPELEDIFGGIEVQAEYMNKIVSDLQDYARPLKPIPEQTSLRQLIDDVAATMMIPESIEVTVTIPETLQQLMVDPSMIRRVFTNLITNALQAMPSGGRLIIDASQTGQTVSISIRDTGIGIPRENLPRIFQPLFTTKAKGTGLGLPVCKRLVEAHGGQITVDSEAGKGTVFTIELPIGVG